MRRFRPFRSSLATVLPECNSAVQTYVVPMMVRARATAARGRAASTFVAWILSKSPQICRISPSALSFFSSSDGSSFSKATMRASMPAAGPRILRSPRAASTHPRAKLRRLAPSISAVRLSSVLSAPVESTENWRPRDAMFETSSSFLAAGKSGSFARRQRRPPLVSDALMWQRLSGA